MTIMVMMTFDDEEGLSMLLKLLMCHTYIFLHCQAPAPVPVKTSKGEEGIWRKLRKKIRKRVRTLQHFTL